ncbi:MAG: transcriptional regulator [Candidatus Woesearchaeota archaeon]
MVNKNGFLLPQEIEVFYVIPTIRRYLAVYMKSGGLKQSRIAELLQIDRAAVSQYISKKRGAKVKFNKSILEEISKSASNIDDKFSVLREIQRLLRVVKDSGELCRIHRQFCNVTEQCRPVLVNCCEDRK